MSPRPKITDVRREEIVRAALEVISQRGFHETRVADIAQRAGTSAPAVLYHFRSKGELVVDGGRYAEDDNYFTKAVNSGPLHALANGTDAAVATAGIILMRSDLMLVPALRRGDVVIFDNLASHFTPGVAEAIERVGARVLPLPPYSPDLNPIEEMFSKFKEFLRRAAARTKDHLIETIGEALRMVTT